MFDINKIMGSKRSGSYAGVKFSNNLLGNTSVNRMGLAQTRPSYSSSWRKFKWKRQNLLKGVVPNLPGIYIFFNESNKMLYVGHSSMLRHRLQSYYQQDCFSEHPTKKKLRSHIDMFAFKVMSVSDARSYERIIKQQADFNYR